RVILERAEHGPASKSREEVASGEGCVVCVPLPLERIERAIVLDEREFGDRAHREDGVRRWQCRRERHERVTAHHQARLGKRQLRTMKAEKAVDAHAPIEVVADETEDYDV